MRRNRRAGLPAWDVANGFEMCCASCRGPGKRYPYRRTCDTLFSPWLLPGSLTPAPSSSYHTRRDSPGKITFNTHLLPHCCVPSGAHSSRKRWLVRLPSAPPSISSSTINCPIYLSAYAHRDGHLPSLVWRSSDRMPRPSGAGRTGPALARSAGSRDLSTVSVAGRSGPSPARASRSRGFCEHRNNCHGRKLVE